MENKFPDPSKINKTICHLLLSFYSNSVKQVRFQKHLRVSEGKGKLDFPEPLQHISKTRSKIIGLLRKLQSNLPRRPLGPIH